MPSKFRCLSFSRASNIGLTSHDAALSLKMEHRLLMSQGQTDRARSIPIFQPTFDICSIPHFPRRLAAAASFSSMPLLLLLRHSRRIGFLREIAILRIRHTCGTSSRSLVQAEHIPRPLCQKLFRRAEGSSRLDVRAASFTESPLPAAWSSLLDPAKCLIVQRV